MSERANKKFRTTDKILASIFMLVVVFSLGVNFGRGNISFFQNNLSPVTKNSAGKLNFSEVQTLYDKLRQNYDGQLDDQALLDGMKHGLISAAGDRYTQYMDPKEAKEFSEDLNGIFSGIGAVLMEDKNKMVMIETPLTGRPAEKAGLRAKDVIIEINGESAIDLRLSEAVKKIRGEAGTKVKLKVVRGSKDQLDFEITRATINIPSVESEVVDGNIGYMKVSRFDQTTGPEAKKAAEEFLKSNVKGVILDLRNNPGGELNAAVALSGIWLPRGETVLSEKRDGKTIKTYDSSGQALLNDMPTVVLINEGSASASEIVAGALKDNKAATLMGEKSFGKGSVQSVDNLPNGGILKVTIARWFTPNGKNIDKEGIDPDKKVELKVEDFQEGRDPQKAAAIEALK